MIHLLTETSIFVSLPNGCLCQITGEPLIHMSPKSHIVEPFQRIQIQQPITKVNSGKKRTWTEVEDANQQPQPKRRKLGSISTGTAVGWRKPTQSKLYVLHLLSWICGSRTIGLPLRMYMFRGWRYSIRNRTTYHIPIKFWLDYPSDVSSLHYTL